MMHPLWKTGRIRFLGALAIAFLTGFASHTATLAADVTVEQVLTDLNAPCAIAIRPGSNPAEVFVAECGAGRIIKLAGNDSGNRTEVISGLPLQTASSSASNVNEAAAGVQSLLFLDPMRLVVTGGEENGKPFVRLYEVVDPNAKLEAADHKQNLEMPDDEEAADDVHSFHNLARTQPNDKVPDLLIAAATGKRDPAGLWKIAVRANTLGDIASFGNAASSASAESIGGIAIAKTGYVAIAGEDKTDANQINALTFISPVDGRTFLQIKTDLQRILALAYSPKSGNLYAAAAPSRGKSGGIYRLDDTSELGKPACKSVKIVDVARPTALAFTADGTLFVTSLGDDNEKGTLIKITSEL